MDPSLIFHDFLRMALMSFLIGVYFREFATDTLGKWIGRAAIAVSLFLLVCFGEYSTRVIAEETHAPVVAIPEMADTHVVYK
jgi:hypothetical protein